MFGCALNYVTMRLLGVDAQDKHLLAARHMLRSLGTLTFAAVTVYWCHVNYQNQNETYLVV